MAWSAQRLSSSREQLEDLQRRVSDAEREHAVVWLREHLLAGRLSLEEFSERVEQAYAAVVQADLERVRAGLPGPHEAPAAAASRPRTMRFTAALMAHVVRRGRLTIKRWSVAGGALCDIDLDLRKAQLRGERSLLTIFVGLGNVDVYVPENVNVSVSGLAVAGHRREWGEEIERPGAPRISIRALSIFGTVDVWRVPADMPGDYGAITRELQRRQRALPP